MKNRRFYIEKDLEKFCQDKTQEEITISEDAGNPEEKFMLALRTTKGIPLKVLSTKAQKKSEILIKNNYIKAENDWIHLTPEGFVVSNAVIAMLLE